MLSAQFSSPPLARLRPRRHRWPGLGLAATIASGVALAVSATLLCTPQALPAHATELDQSIDTGQEHASDQVVRESGHLDFGPSYADGTWRFQIHDDSEPTAYWRDFSDVVIRVTDDAALHVPESDEFSFLPAAPGETVYVIPQTQKPEVVWLGWNTQEPQARAQFGTGVTVTVTQVSGPGDISVFMQNGNFGAPDELWNSTSLPGNFWMETNTHTHANWVFTQPGAYLVDITLEAELTDGTTATMSDTLRFAVGSATEASSVFALQSSSSDQPAAAAAPAGAPTAVPLWAFIAGGSVIALLVAAIACVTILRARTARREDGTRRVRGSSPGSTAVHDGVEGGAA